MVPPGADRGWQDIDYTCHLCHWWQDFVTGRITAMSLTLAFLILVGLAALVAIVAELRHVIRGDGYGHRPAPRSLADDNESRTATLARLGS
jgi:hypothetical protein